MVSGVGPMVWGVGPMVWGVGPMVWGAGPMGPLDGGGRFWHPVGGERLGWWGGGAHFTEGGVEGGDCTNSYSSINRYHGNDYNLLSY